MILTEKDLPAFGAAGRLTAAIMEKACAMVRPGITPKAIDRMIGWEIFRGGGRSAPRWDYKFPGSACISVNRVAAHGIPNDMQLCEGDTVNIDISLRVKGCYADMGRTVTVGEAQPHHAALVAAARTGFEATLPHLYPGAPVRAIGAAMEQAVERAGFHTIVNLAGHGIGKKLHDDPHLIFCYDNPEEERTLEAGMLLAVECFVSDGDRQTQNHPDGWGLVLPYEQRAAQWENTLLITPGGPILFTDKELDVHGIRIAAETPRQ